jgi:hypothetical protein
MATDLSPPVHPATTEFDEAFRETIAENAVALHASRSLALQSTAAAAFSDLEATAVELKKQAVRDGDEDAAARLLMGECLADGLKSQLRMWIAFREGRMDDAWSWLVHAQTAFAAAIRAHLAGDQFRHFAEDMSALEVLLFPRQLFLSTAWITRRSQCTLCDAPFGSCEHIHGRVYGGEFAGRLTTEGEPIDVSIVDVPDDKNCRAHAVTADGVQRNVLTWEPTDESL